MMAEGKTAKKPDFEYFYGKKWKAFCGNCFRCIWLIDYPKPETCKWCGEPIDWRDSDE